MILIEQEVRLYFENRDMVVFRKKKIVTVRTIGEDLRLKRNKLHLSLRAVEKKTGIPNRYLVAMESDEWGSLPEGVYRYNFLKRYSVFLGFDFAVIRKRFDKDNAIEDIEDGGVGRVFSKKTEKGMFVILPKMIRKLTIVAFIFVVLIYLGFQVWFLVRPTNIEILYPEQDFRWNNNYLKLLGRVDDRSIATIDGDEITVDEGGYFTLDINLNKGLNVVTIKAEKPFGKESLVERRIIVE